LEYGKSLAAGLLAGKEEPKVLAVEDPTRPEIVKRADMARSSREWPDWLLSPPGYVGDLCKWMNETAGCAQPKLSVVASLVAAGALFGGKVRDISNGRTNLYAMGVAPSSAGKDHPFKCILQLFVAAGGEKLLGGGRVSSDSAIEVALMAHPVQLFGIDEAGEFLTHIRQGTGTGTASHLVTIKPALKELWSSANCLYRGKQRIDADVRKIMEPHVCLWALTTPGRLYEGINSCDMEDGFIPRMIFALSNECPEYEMREFRPPPKSLMTLTQAWLSRAISSPVDSEGDILSAVSKHQLLVPMQHDAMMAFREFGRFCKRQMGDGEETQDKTGAIWGKGLENSRRVALTLATGERYDGPEILGFHAEYSCALIKQTILDLIDSIKAHMSENQWQAHKKDILKIIARAGANGISKSELTNKTQWLQNSKVRNSYIEDMTEAGLIVIGKKNNKTWIWRFPYGIKTEGSEE
jgi:hypothetical protein